MRNQALYAHLRQFCADASAKILVASDGGKQLPVITERRMRFESGVPSEVAEPVVPWGDVLPQLKPVLRGLPSYKPAAETLETDEQVARHLEVLVGPAGGNRFRLSADHALCKLFFDLIDEQNGLAFQDAILYAFSWVV